MSKSQYACEVDGCDVDPAKGGAVFRTSPKGEPFRGRCRAHMTAPIDSEVSEIAQIVETGNAR